MNDVILRGFAPEHLKLAIDGVKRYTAEHPDAPPGIAGTCAFAYLENRVLVRFYVYRTKGGNLTAVCSSTKEEKR